MNFNSLFTKSIKTRSQLINYQTLRWRRSKKPFWLGIAKSKMFIIPQPRINPPPEEKAEIRTLFKHYNTHHKSLMNFIKVDNPTLKEINSLGENRMTTLVTEKDIMESLKTNEIWNKESARRRDERMKKSMEEAMENAIREIDVKEELKMKQMEMIEEIVRKEKVLSASYITPENIDEAIENCLNKVECYDFAIDLEGNKYTGRESLLSPVRKTNEEIPI